MMMTRSISRPRGGTWFVAAAAVLALCWRARATAHAQEGPGVEIGVSAQPDQFYFGAHYLTAPIASRSGSGRTSRSVSAAARRWSE